MRYEIVQINGLYCVFRTERYVSQIVAAFDTPKAAKEAVERYRKLDRASIKRL